MPVITGIYFCEMKQFIFLCAVLMAVGCSNPSNDNSETIESVTAGEWQVGKQLFYTRCASCHMVNKEMTGPALKGVENRWPDKQILYAFIRNSQEIIGKDKYARELWLQYNQTIMLPHPDLTDQQIAQILGYINSVSDPPKP